MIKGRFLPPFLPAILVLALGCTTTTTPCQVSGKVSYKDQPVTAGNISFHAQQADGTPGPQHTFPINPDGTYSGYDLPPGDMKVTIETESANKDRKMPVYGGRPGAGSSPPPEGAGSGTAEKGAYVKIPAKYKDVKTSELTATLAKGKNTYNFDLKD
jgi:hypothetical protein